jgi:hypothetical protein
VLMLMITLGSFKFAYIHSHSCCVSQSFIHLPGSAKI